MEFSSAQVVPYMLRLKECYIPTTRASYEYDLEVAANDNGIYVYFMSSITHAKGHINETIPCLKN